MKQKVIFLTILMMFLTGCGAVKHQPTVIYRDSVRTEYRDRIVRDTVEFELPVIIEKYVTTDTLSVIENEYARTAAVVHDGFLSHDLQIKPKVLKVPVAVEVHDTLVVQKKAETVTEYVEVERKLTLFQKLFIWAGKIAFGVALIAAIFFIARAIYKSQTSH